MGNTNIRIAPTATFGTVKETGVSASHLAGFPSETDDDILSQSVFDSMLTLECRRAQRSNKSFVLMLLDAELGNGLGPGILSKAIRVALEATRETDLVGWYIDGCVLGVIFTEVNSGGERSVEEILRERMESNLTKHLGRERAANIGISLHVFPECMGKDLSVLAADSKIYSRSRRADSQQDLSRVNMIDIPGTAILIFALSPMFAALAGMMKL